MFWAAYILDQSDGILLGTSPVQHPDDMDVEFPQADISDQPNDAHSASSLEGLEYFRQLCQLSYLKGKVYFEIYCPRKDVTPLVFCKRVCELHAELEEWWENFPFKDPFGRGSTESDYLTKFSSVGLQAMYYNCLIMTHRIVPRINLIIMRTPRMWRSPSDIATVERQTPISTSICLTAARDTLKLVNHVPWSDVALAW